MKKIIEDLTMEIRKYKVPLNVTMQYVYEEEPEAGQTDERVPERAYIQVGQTGIIPPDNLAEWVKNEYLYWLDNGEAKMQKYKSGDNIWLIKGLAKQTPFTGSLYQWLIQMSLAFNKLPWYKEGELSLCYVPKEERADVIFARNEYREFA